MKDDLIRRSDAIGAITNHCENECYYRVDNWCPQCQREEFEEAIKAVPSADRPQNVVAQITFDEEKLREIVKEAVERFKEEYEITDRPQGEWIPCSERLPSECDMFLITWTASVTNEPLLAFAEYEPDAFLVSGGKWHLEDDMREFKDVDVIAWMPLPAPYKEENGKR